MPIRLGGRRHEQFSQPIHGIPILILYVLTKLVHLYTFHLYNSTKNPP